MNEADDLEMDIRNAVERLIQTHGYSADSVRLIVENAIDDYNK